nr:PREDICTED: superoxide dismutase [Cu-Zn]-like [Bemisia tabaci]
MAPLQQITIAVAVILCLSQVSLAQKGKKAVAVIKTDIVSGVIKFSQENATAPVFITGQIEGLSKGNHGFHIHEKGDTSGGCGTTGSHYNPHKANHGGPSDQDRHIGDLGNIYAEPSGVAQINIVDPKITLVGKYSIIGRAVVVHADPDDLGRRGHPDSKTTGHAGGRLGCGVIGIEHPPDFWNSSSTASSSILLILAAVIISGLANSR